MAKKRKIFNDPVHGFITVPYQILFNVIEHPWFQRLRRIKQLGLTDYVYPGASHTRFHHALGATHLMQKAINMLRLKDCEISKEEEKAALLAILLHDVGHGPFSHTLENCLIQGVHHEQLSLTYMQAFKDLYPGEFDMAIEIFQGTYEKAFLHELVSSQLDVDRLDYLTRDSFFTGVSEGVVGIGRIIEMLDVHDGHIVVEAKGLYSIERFITARRLMYWQVYLHKTVLCVEHMMIKAVERAKELIGRGEKLPASETLSYFLQNKPEDMDFSSGVKALEYFGLLDDHDVISALKAWMKADDMVLAHLCDAIVNRHLFKIEMQGEPFAQQKKEAIGNAVKTELNISAEDLHYFMIEDVTSNHAYDQAKGRIAILHKDGSLKDFSEDSDHGDLTSIIEPVSKHYLCYPKGLSI
jgi:HD superfamily phosphohydrolase